MDVAFNNVPSRVVCIDKDDPKHVIDGLKENAIAEPNSKIRFVYGIEQLVTQLGRDEELSDCIADTADIPKLLAALHPLEILLGDFNSVCDLVPLIYSQF